MFDLARYKSVGVLFESAQAGGDTKINLFAAIDRAWVTAGIRQRSTADRLCRRGLLFIKWL